MINSDNLKHLAELARLGIIKEQEEKLLKNLEDILFYFEQLKQVDTSKTEPLIGAGGAGSFKNIFREDGLMENNFFNKNLVKDFPEEQDGFLNTEHFGGQSYPKIE